MAYTGNTDTTGYNSVIARGEDGDPAMIKAVLPPIGTIMSWLKDYTNTPSLPDGWLECNGQTLSDSDSPYNGQVIPDLNGDNRFLRGNSTSGATGGEETTPAHYHITFLPEGRGGSTGGGVDGDTSYQTDSKNAHDNRPPFYDVVWIMRIK